MEKINQFTEVWPMAAKALNLETSLEIVVSRELVTQLASARFSLVVSVDYKFVG